jgi:hypothetical protein
VLVQEIDMIGAQAAQRGLDNVADVRGPAVQPDHLPPFVDVEAELGADQNLVAHRLKGFADKLLVRVRPVTFGRIEQRDPPVDCRPDDADRFLLVGGGAKAEAQSHAAKTNGGYKRAVFSEGAGFHLESSFVLSVMLRLPLLVSEIGGPFDGRAPIDLAIQSSLLCKHRRMTLGP